MEQRLADLATQNTQLEAEITTNEGEVELRNKSHESVSQRFGEAKLRSTSLSQRLDEAQQQAAAATAELATVETEAEQAKIETTSLEERLLALRSELQDLETQLLSDTEQCTQLEAALDTLTSAATDMRVELARCEQRRDGLARQSQQLHRDHEEHDRALAETQQREQESQAQFRQLEQSVLTLSSNLAEWYYEKEQLLQQLQQQDSQHVQHRRQRAEIVKQADAMRGTLLTSQSQLQQIELSLQQLEHRRSDLATRMKDDYGLELAVLATNKELSPEQLGTELSDTTSETRRAIDAEIEQLKQKLQGIGPVNLEALSELEAVEDRHSALAEQYADLQDAKAKLEQLVKQINAGKQAALYGLVGSDPRTLSGVVQQSVRRWRSRHIARYR